MMGSTSGIFLCLCVLLSFAWGNLLSEIEHCELDCASETVEGLNVIGNCEPKCSKGLTIPSQIEKQGQDAIKAYLDNLFTNALFPDASTQTDIHAIHGERNMDAEKAGNEVAKKGGEEDYKGRDIEKEGEEAMKEYLDSVFSSALLGSSSSDSTQTGQNLEAHLPTHSIQHHTKTATQTKHQEQKPFYCRSCKESKPERLATSKLGRRARQLREPKRCKEQSKRKMAVESQNGNTTHKGEINDVLFDFLFTNGRGARQIGGDRGIDAHKSSYKVPKKSEDQQLLDLDFAMDVNLEMVDNGEYILKIKKINLSSSDEDEVERAKHMAQNGAMLLLYGEMLQDTGEKLIAQSQSLIYSIFDMSAPPKSKFDK
ncbi:hypothetical protein Fmac_012212 [Flemingia macrophylla]|uniref:Uncharacterized protein n=1 Tax=Flemingia macrophylla TaxID=520843 RepID=A0ABD1MPP0_9FABA